MKVWGKLTMVNAHSRLAPVEKVTISKFKAICLALLDKVKRTGKPILVTRKGEPIAQIVPPLPPEKPGSWLGSFASSGKIVGDVISPALDEQDWDMGSSGAGRKGPSHPGT